MHSCPNTIKKVVSYCSSFLIFFGKKKKKIHINSCSKTKKTDYILFTISDNIKS